MPQSRQDLDEGRLAISNACWASRWTCGNTISSSIITSSQSDKKGFVQIKTPSWWLPFIFFASCHFVTHTWQTEEVMMKMWLALMDSCAPESRWALLVPRSFYTKIRSHERCDAEEAPRRRTTADSVVSAKCDMPSRLWPTLIISATPHIVLRRSQYSTCIIWFPSSQTARREGTMAKRKSSS